jgi:hypothetical protein
VQISETTSLDNLFLYAEQLIAAGGKARAGNLGHPGAVQ